MANAARSRALVGKYAFWVRDLDFGLVEAKFQKATGAAMTINQGEYQEGGALAPMKEATTASFSNVTLERGVDISVELLDWVKTVCDMMVNVPFGSGTRSPNHLRNISIEQRRRDRSVLRTTRMFNCQPAGYDPGEHDNTSTEIQLETLEFSMEFFDITY